MSKVIRLSDRDLEKIDYVRNLLIESDKKIGIPVSPYEDDERYISMIIGFSLQLSINILENAGGVK